MFRRRSGEADPVAAFWAWWRSSGRRAAEATIAGGDDRAFVAAASAAVDRIDPDLEWELAKGRSARHALVVTAAGIAAQRPAAERWIRAAPPADATWEFHAARQPDPSGLGHRLDVGGRSLDLGEIRIAQTVDAERALVDVVVHHPAYAAMDDRGRGQVTFLVLDWLLGEDGVTRWIGAVSSAPALPPDALPGDALVDTVDALAARPSTPSWTLLEGLRDGRRVIVLALRPMKWIDHVLHDQHVALVLRYDANLDGLPTAAALERLRAVQDAVEDALAARLVVVAVETTEGVRTIHAYAADPAVADEVRVRAPGATVAVDHDPGWRTVRAFR